MAPLKSQSGHQSPITPISSISSLGDTNVSNFLQRDIMVENFISKLKRRQILGSSGVSLEAAQLIRWIVSQTRWQTAEQLLRLLRDIGSLIIKAQPTELAAGNIVRRVLKLIRDEYKSISEEIQDDENDQIEKSTKKQVKIEDELYISDEEVPYKILESKKDIMNDQIDCPSVHVTTSIDSSMYNLLAQAHILDIESTGGEQMYREFRKIKSSLKPLVIQGINELIDEIETAKSNMNIHALDHIHNGDHIMTIGRSKTVEEFLLTAARKRTFSVTVCETAPIYEGHSLAENLITKSNASGMNPIDVTITTESAIGSMMGKINKIIIGCHAVLANGGLMCITGTQILLTCAAHYEIPVVVVTGIYKLSPSFPSDRHALYCPVTPSGLMNYDSAYLDKVTMYSPYYDYVDPNFVSLFITNVGGHPPSYLYRLIGEFYDRVDDDL